MVKEKASLRWMNVKSAQLERMAIRGDLRLRAVLENVQRDTILIKPVLHLQLCARNALSTTLDGNVPVL